MQDDREFAGRHHGEAICPAAAAPVYDARISGRPRTPDEKLWRTGYPSSNGASASGPTQGFSRLLVLAYVTAISVPPLGLALGVAVALRLGKTRHAILIVLLSLATAVIWVLILSSGSLNSGSSTDF